jgi:hypothetical protein
MVKFIPAVQAEEGTGGDGDPGECDTLPGSGL